MARLWTRTCQECGYKLRKSTEPSDTRKASPAYGYIACKKCGSEAYDYGSWQCDETDCDNTCDERGCLNLRKERAYAMWRIHATINYAGPDYLELDPQGPWTLEQVIAFQRTTLAEYRDKASSFDFILIPVEG